MVYSVKEIFYSLQGEGAHTGRPSVFLRFAGCNLWSGREQDRAKAVCKFCDTDFVGTGGTGGGQFETAAALAKTAVGYFPAHTAQKWVICTGGEPLLQLDTELIEALHDEGIRVAVESNGTLKAAEGIDWLCISPKADAPLVQTSGDELKLVYPQAENRPEDFEHLDFKMFYLQPLDDEKGPEHIRAALAYCLAHPKWRLSLQTHKILMIR